MCKLKITKDKYPTIIKLYKDGQTTSQIAKGLMCGSEAIRNILKKEGIDRRSPNNVYIYTSTKMCSQCGEEYPNNSEYFFLKGKIYKNGKIKLRSECKKCSAAYGNIYSKNRKLIDINFKLRKGLSGRIRSVLKSSNIKKKMKTMEMIGCSISELKKHLKMQFKQGMSWDNYGEWHIDHIKPCAAFNLANDEEQKICFHYTNLQPLWAIENAQKSSIYEGKRIAKF